ncbi:ABC transporter permease [Halobacteriales archaeon SW_7_68_16]|nr:MAG: ABC transporter permease [Halobacteriales archaeon SW_7_68_16]
MSDLTRLVRKEVRELARPRYLLPLLFVPVVFVALGGGIGGVEEALTDQPRVGLVVDDDGRYGDLVAASVANATDVVYRDEGVEAATAVERTRAAGGEAVIVIPDGFSERIAEGERGRADLYSIVDTVSLTGVAGPSGARRAITGASGRITLAVTNATPTALSPIETTETTYLRGERIDGPASQLTRVFSTQFVFVPVVILLVILVSGQMVMNSMGVEAENKTLETLLTMPVERRTIVAAKLVGSSAIGVAGAALYTVALFYYGSSFAGGGSVPAAFTLSSIDYLIVGVSVALTLIGTLAVALSLGTFAGDRQGAQLLLLPLSVLAVVPMLVTLFSDVTTLSVPIRAVVYLIPFTHPIVAPKQLLFGDPTLVYLGLIYEAVFAAGSVALAVRLFESDRLVTGESGRLGRLLSRLQD